MKMPALCVAVSLTGSAVSQSVVAQTATTNFNVTITIQNECVIVSGSDMDFGTTGTLTTVVNAQSNIVVNCTSGADYDIALDQGTTGVSTASRAMANGSDTVAYQLYSDAARSIVWGQGVDEVSATGTGANQTFPVYGQVPVQDTPPAATYNDIVGVVVSF